MKRRRSDAPQREIDVAYSMLDKIAKDINVLLQPRTLTIQPDDHTAIADPVPFGIVINRNGAHAPATDESNFVYYHPGKEDESGELVEAGHKEISGTIVRDFAYGGCFVVDGETLPAGQNVVKAPFGNWFRMSTTNPTIFEAGDNPASDGVFLRVKKGGLYLVILDLNGIVSTTFAGMFEMGISWQGEGTDNDFFSIQPESAAALFRPSHWSNLVRPTKLQCVGYDIIPDDGNYPYNLVWNNYSGSGKTIPLGSMEFHFSMTRIGTIPEVTTVIPT